MGRELRTLRLRMFDFTFVALSHLTTLLLETSDSAQRLADSCFFNPPWSIHLSAGTIRAHWPSCADLRALQILQFSALLPETEISWGARGLGCNRSNIFQEPSDTKSKHCEILKAVCSQLLLNPNCLAVDFSEVLPCYGHSDEAIAHHHTVTQDGTASCSWVKNER